MDCHPPFREVNSIQAVSLGHLIAKEYRDPLLTEKSVPLHPNLSQDER